MSCGLADALAPETPQVRVPEAGGGAADAKYMCKSGRLSGDSDLAVPWAMFRLLTNDNRSIFTEKENREVVACQEIQMSQCRFVFSWFSVVFREIVVEMSPSRGGRPPAPCARSSP